MPKTFSSDIKRKGGRAARTIPQPPLDEREAASFPIVGIGASAGGFEAFRRMLQALPPNTGMAFVFVQHMEPEHKSMLPRLFSKVTQMPVIEARQGIAVEPNHVYVIPPKTDMGIQNGVLQIFGRKKSGGRYLPVDYFLRSLAEDQRGSAIGVILSGTASDGTIGLNAIKAEGGITFAQDEESSKYYGMPGSAIASGCVDFDLPPDRISKELARMSRHPYVGLPHYTRLPEEVPAGEDDFRKILYLLRAGSGVDFGAYKPGTVRRRIARRMVLNGIENIKKYVALLQTKRAELDALFQDILIHVTGFFREPEAFKLLQVRTFPSILPAKKPGEAIRIWVPGCSTGEEVYSLAIALLEYLGDQASSTPIQIFGTDISEPTLEKARAGEYGEASLRDVASTRLRRYFAKTDSGCQISKIIREMCVFARHDLTKDPPFSRLDLISCRNVLIYIGAAAQRRIVANFHYALADTGFLLLGKSESLTASADLFTLADKKVRIFAKKADGGIAAAGLSRVRHEKPEPLASIAKEPPIYDALKEADRLVWQRYSHAGLVLNDNLDILHFRGNTSPYLSPTSGKASLNVLHMVREDLKMALRSAIRKAARLDEPVRSASIRMKHNGATREVSLEVAPLIRPASKERHFVVLFDEARPPAPLPAAEEPAKGERRDAGKNREMARLQRELDASREYLQSVVEQYEAASEELKSANEEILSSNEELQSTNEELETAKEELQSANEELVTMNDTLQARNVELIQIGDDLDNVIKGTHIPILIVGNDSRIRRFTPAAEKLLNLRSGDVGRPIGNIRPNIKFEDLEDLMAEASRTLAERQQEIQDRDGHWLSMWARPYKTAENKIDGVLFSFHDIDGIKRANETLRESEAIVRALLETLVSAVLVVEREGCIVMVNAGAEQIFGYSRDEMVGRQLEMLLPERFRRAHADLCSEYIASPKTRPMGEGLELIGRRKNGTEFPLVASLSAIVTPGKNLAVAFVSDITERKRLEVEVEQRNANLQASQRQLQALTASLISAQEEERERLARELHDELNQQLAVLAINAKDIVQQAPESASGLRENADKLHKSLVELSDDVRRIAHELHPSILEHLGLTIALRSFCREFSKRTGINVTFRPRNTLESIPEDVALCLYRVTQECLHNVAKHSGSKTASVILGAAASSLYLVVRDRGAGIIPDRMSDGIGLVNVEQRVLLVGGSVSIESRPGEGTRIEVRIPLKVGAQ
jgi:two-component system, chemotaxis family, CheB/CheR fusion protein